MVGVVKLGKIFRRILFEFWYTRIAAELDLLSFMIDDDRIAHRSEFFSRNETGIKRIGFGTGFGSGCNRGAFLLVTRNGSEGDGGERDQDDVHGS